MRELQLTFPVLPVHELIATNARLADSVGFAGTRVQLEAREVGHVVDECTASPGHIGIPVGAEFLERSSSRHDRSVVIDVAEIVRSLIFAAELVAELPFAEHAGLATLYVNEVACTTIDFE